MQITFEKITELDFRSNESYKALRTNIAFCGDDVKVVAFTSATPNEGKSAVSFQLAKAFGEDEKKTLYIDADIRKSVLESRYGVEQETKGLSHYLAGQAKLEEIICTTNIHNMDVVFTGPVAPNPSELLGNAKFEKLISTARETYDYVIIDTPPRSKSVAVINAMTTSDEVIIPMQANSFSIEGLQKILETFEMVKKYTNHNIKVLGILMTMYEDRTLFRRGITKQMENLSSKIQIPLFKPTIRRAIAMEEAQSQKTNVFEYNMKSNVAKDYQDFIDEVIKKEKELGIAMKN